MLIPTSTAVEVNFLIKMLLKVAIGTFYNLKNFILFHFIGNCISDHLIQDFRFMGGKKTNFLSEKSCGNLR